MNRRDPILEVDLNWFLVLGETGNHFRITGDTDTGKSTLMENLVNVMRQVWTNLRLSVADPKYPNTPLPNERPLSRTIKALQHPSVELLHSKG